MKRKLAVLLLIPILIMAVDLNEANAIWTHDEGFFKQYRQIQVRALNVDGDVVIWGKECNLPSRGLIFDPYNHSVIAAFNDFDGTLQEHMNAESLFIKDALSSDWDEVSANVRGNEINSFSYHKRTATQVVLLAGTPNGVYQSPNGGATWSGVSSLPYNIYDAVLSPVNQTGGLFDMSYFAATPGGVYMKDAFPIYDWELLPSMDEDQDFEDVNPLVPGYLDSLPEGWTQTGVEDEYRYVRLDTLNTYSGNYSLLVYSNAVGGADVAARYDLPDVDYAIFDFQFMPILHSGIMEFKNGLEMKIAYRYGEMSYYSPSEGWVEIDGSGVNMGVFNEVTLVLDFASGIGFIATPASVDTVDLYPAEDAVSEVVFSAESFGAGSYPYWIDDFSVQPAVYAVAPHPDSQNYAFAGTPLGIYSYDGSEWSKSLDVVGEWTMLKTDLAGDYLVAATPNLVYLSDDQGVSWNNITGAIPSINDIYVDTSGVIYAATDSFPYKYDVSWTEMSKGFLENGVMNQVKICNAITVMGLDTIFVGTLNGIYVSVDDGDNWVEDNGGIDPYPIDSATVAQVDAYFEDAVPSSSTTGLLDLLTDGIGPVPDVDGDALVHVILLEIYEDGPDGSEAYFDPRNEEPATVEHSNEAEMIYVDVDFWQNNEEDTKESIARSLTQMIEWNYDSDEDDWIVTGFERYGAYLAEFGATYIDSGINFQANNLTLTNTSEHQEYLWIQYLRDKFGGDILDDLNLAEGVFIDPQSGNPEIKKLQGMEAIDSILVGKTPGSFVEAFKDWSISCYLDNLTHVKYITQDIAQMASDGGRQVRQAFFSAKAWRIRNTSKPLIFSGNDNNDFNLHVVEYNGGVAGTPEEIEYSDFDIPDRNLHEVVKTSDSFDILIEVISSAGTDPANAFYNLSRETVMDTLDMLGILQAPLADRYLRIYYYTNKTRFLDAGEEGVYVIYESNTSELSLMDTLTTAEGYWMYYGDITLPVVDGTVTLSFLSEDISGVLHTPEYHITVKSIGTGGGYIAASDNSFNADIPANALDKSYHVTACKTGNNSYYIGPGVSLNKNAVLTIDVSARKSRNLSIYRKEADSWVEIPCTRKGDKLEAEISAFGEYKVTEGDLVTNLPLTLQLSTNTLNSFDIRYAIPEKGNVRLDVYNALGQRVKFLVNGVMMPGFYAVRWNGRTENGGLVGNGVYFYRLSAVGNRLTKKIVVVR